MTTLYKDSFFSLPNSPENLSGGGETILASIYREGELASAYGELLKGSGRDVSTKAEKLRKQVDKGHLPSSNFLDAVTFKRVLYHFAEAPKPDGQRRDVLGLVPLVPATAACSGIIRQRGSPWNPGHLIFGALESCGKIGIDAWNELIAALQVTDGDDPWAKILQHDLGHWLEANPQSLEKARESENLEIPDLIPQPAQQFAVDLRTICRLKPSLTRRSWIACLESLLRLGSVLQTVWLCRANTILWDEVIRITHNPQGDIDHSTDRVIKLLGEPICEVEDRVSNIFATIASNYFRSREHFESLDRHEISLVYPNSAQPEKIRAFLRSISVTAVKITKEFYVKTSNEIESKQSALSCKSGYPKNLKAFWTYTLRRRQTTRSQDREYDQGYWTTNSGERGGSLIFRPGPLAVLVLVHACCARRRISTVSDLMEHMQKYGVQVSTEAFNSGQMGRTLRKQGAVVDSPDAEKGMTLLSPLE